MKLKITPNLILEKANPLPDTFDLHLVGTESLYPYFPDIADDINSQNNSFINTFGTNSRFYYRLEKYHLEEVTDIEIGIGCLIKDKDIVILRRLQPFISKYKDESPQPCPTPIYNFRVCDSNEYIVARSHVPTSPQELLIDPYSTIVSQELGFPQPIKIQPHSVLARSSEGISSIKASDLNTLEGFSDATKDALCEYTKQLVLNTSQLYSKKLKTEQLQLNPCNINVAKKGTMIYNEEKDAICYFNGDRWRTLAWHEEA